MDSRKYSKVIYPANYFQEEHFEKSPNKRLS